MPIRELSYYADALPSLRAAETMSLAQAAAYGSGSLKSSDARNLWRSWEQMANAGRGEQRGPRTPAELLATFQSLGIPVELVKPGGQQDEPTESSEEPTLIDHSDVNREIGQGVK